MKNSLIWWLAAKGITLANDASDQTVLTAVQKAFVDAAAPASVLANEKTTLGENIITLETKVATLENEKATAATTLANEAAGRKAERLGRAIAVVDLAIQKGKLAVAGRAAQITALENSADFDKDATALMAKANIVRMREDTSSGKVLANAMGDADVRKTYCDAVGKHMKDTGDNDPIKAHNAVMTALPALAEALKNPSGEAKPA
jgi:hypothetical protein